MNVDCFLDTNVLVYAAANDPETSDKRYRAQALIESRDFALSAQVLQEFYVTVTRKLEVGLSPAEALEWIEQFEAFPCMSVDAGLVKVAAELAERFRVSCWDAAIIAAAERAGAETLYSEDLNDGQRYGNVTVVNPFPHSEARSVQQPDPSENA
jgi:predicted nucleic acid-binding protein